MGAIDQLQKLVPVFVLFPVVAALMAKVVAQQLRLPVEQGRTLAISMGNAQFGPTHPRYCVVPTFQL